MKVKSQEPPIENPMSQMAMPQQDMGGEFGTQGNEVTSMMPMSDSQQQSEFDTNFDPGVEADEEQDPKKFIQQLTGKLSQSLRKYNEDNGQPDVDLDKYVAGMIVKQAIDGLSQEDVDDILDKIKSDEDSSQEDQNQEKQDIQRSPMNDDQMSVQQPQPNEGVNRRNDAKLEEIVNDVLQNIGKKEETNQYQQTKGDKGFRKKPFTSPNFKK